MTVEPKQQHRWLTTSRNWRERLAKLFAPGPLAYLVHAERLEGLCVPRFRYIRAIDDFEADIDYQGHALRLGMDWYGDLFLSAGSDVPEPTFRAVADHLEHCRWVSPRILAGLSARYKRPAKATWIEK